MPMRVEIKFTDKSPYDSKKLVINDVHEIHYNHTKDNAVEIAFESNTDVSRNLLFEFIEEYEAKEMK